MKPYPSWEKLYQDADAIIIASPTHTHYDYARKALMAGLHTFVEKPLCTSVSEAEELVALASTKDLITQVGFVERFNPAYKLGTSMINTTAFIKADRWAPFTARGADVSVALDLLSHDLDLALQLIPEEPAQVLAQGASLMTSTPDMVIVTLQFANNRFIWLSVSRVATVRRRIFEVFTNHGIVRMDLLKRRVHLISLNPLEQSNLPHEITTHLYQQKKTRMEHEETGKSITVYEYLLVPGEEDALRSELSAFFRAIQNGTASPVPFHDSLKVIKIIEQIHHQIGKGTRVS